MVQLTIDVPEGALDAVRKGPSKFTQEMRLLAAVKWYELQQVSQGRAAEIAGLSRAEFLAALGRLKVTPFQYSTELAMQEAVELST